MCAFLACVGFLGVWFPVQAQDASPYFTLSQHGDFVQYSINSGWATLPFVMNQPFTDAELRHAFGGKRNRNAPAWLRHWLTLLGRDLYRYNPPDTACDGFGRAYFGINSTLRGFADKSRTWTQARGEYDALFQMPKVVLVNKSVVDGRFKSDPYFYGDTGEIVGEPGESIRARVETGYVRIAYKSMSFFAGRISRNWGMYGMPSLILSDNPYSYDHFGFQTSSRRFRFTFYATRLEDQNAVNIQHGEPSMVKAKRYFSVKRLDYSPMPRLQFGATEVAVYGGANQNFEAVYLNPFNWVHLDQRNQRVQKNGIWCLDGFWKPENYWSLFAQWLVDDIVLNAENRGGVRHPNRMGFSAKLVHTDGIAAGLQCALSYTRIGNWTYTAASTWDNYHTHGLGMGYPKNSFERIGAEADYFAAAPYLIHAGYAFERHGDQQMTAPYEGTILEFPMGIVEKTHMADVAVRYLPNIRFQAEVRLRWQGIENTQNQTGVMKDTFEASVQLFYNFNWAWRM
jgi:hypothetical protein